MRSPKAARTRRATRDNVQREVKSDTETSLRDEVLRQKLLERKGIMIPLTRDSNACVLDESLRRLGFSRVSGRGMKILDKTKRLGAPRVQTG